MYSGPLCGRDGPRQRPDDQFPIEDCVGPLQDLSRRRPTSTANSLLNLVDKSVAIWSCSAGLIAVSSNNNSWPRRGSAAIWAIAASRIIPFGETSEPPNAGPKYSVPWSPRAMLQVHCRHRTGAAAATAKLFARCSNKPTLLQHWQRGRGKPLPDLSSNRGRYTQSQFQPVL